MAEATRVVHVVRPGSAELREHVATLTGALAVRRCEPIVVGPLDRALRDELSRRGVRWVNLPLAGTPSRPELRESAEHVTRLLDSAAPSLVHAHGLPAIMTVHLALRGRRPRPRLVCAPHGVPQAPASGVLPRVASRWGGGSAFRGCDAVIAGSACEAAALDGLAPRGRVRVVPYGVERRRRSSVFDAGQKRRAVGLHQDAAVVVVSAPLVADGPLPGFLHAAALVSERVANVEFAVLGEGPDAEALKALAHELRLSGSTTFLGQRPDSRDVMAAGNIVAVIADDAGGQVQALAGLAAGLRLVAADTPAARELVRGVPSIPLVDLGDPQAFADAILEQLEGLTVEEEEIQANTGMAWGLSEVLASQDEFDLDRPGLDPRDRGKEATSDIERLLAQHSVEAMVVGTMRVYEEVLGTASA